jgi:hypothetical protein
MLGGCQAVESISLLLRHAAKYEVRTLGDDATLSRFRFGKRNVSEAESSDKHEIL